CFVMDMEDDIEHIAKSVRDVMWVTKGTGGIGLSVTKLRAEGSPIRSNNTASTGPIPFMHTIDSTLRAVSRGGKKFGALCFYMENWHLDFPQFLDLRQNAGDPYRRTRTANTAVWISDELMKRVAADDDWYLFDPLETADLTELYGQAFSARYAQYAAAAEAGELRAFARVSAREQVRSIPTSLQPTSHPRPTRHDPPVQLVYRDHLAARPRQHRGVQSGVGEPVAPPHLHRDRAHHRLGAAGTDHPAGRAAVGQPRGHHRVVGAGVGDVERAQPGHRARGHGVHRRDRAAGRAVRQRRLLRPDRPGDGVHQ